MLLVDMDLQALNINHAGVKLTVYQVWEASQWTQDRVLDTHKITAVPKKTTSPKWCHLGYRPKSANQDLIPNATAVTTNTPLLLPPQECNLLPVNKEFPGQY